MPVHGTIYFLCRNVLTADALSTTVELHCSATRKFAERALSDGAEGEGGSPQILPQKNFEKLILYK